MGLPDWSWRDVPYADQYDKMLLSRVTYQGSSQRRGFVKETTLVGINVDGPNVPLFSKSIRLGWQMYGDVPAPLSEGHASTLGCQ